MEKTYSQAGQDAFVLSYFKNGYKGYFIDIGCNLPDKINNTLLLEENGWSGFSLDIVDLKKEWGIRKTPFIMDNALECNYDEIFAQQNTPLIVDYLTLDIEGNGMRFLALKRIMETNRSFKVITIEHDSYRGYELTEREPQRKLLTSMGYILLRPDVESNGLAFEDWWINPKFIKENTK